MRILITGASGYVGSALIDDLRDKYEVIASARDLSRIKQDGIEKVALDISSPEQVQAAIEATKPDVVIHAAALPKRSTVDEDTFIRTNVEGARTVAEAVRNHSNAKFIMLSSGCAFKQTEGEHITAASPREYGSFFSKSKNLSEQVVEEIFAGADDRLALVYPPVILHPAQEKGVIPYSLHDAKSTGIITNKVPGGHVNFITHSKLAELMDAIITDPRKEQGIQRYFITGTRLTTEHFFGKMQQVFGAKFGIECAVKTEADSHMETMCTMDESAIQALKPGFEWGNIDQTMQKIAEATLAGRSLQNRVSQSRLGNSRGI